MRARYRRRSYGPSMFDLTMLLIMIVGSALILALFLTGIFHIP